MCTFFPSLTLLMLALLPVIVLGSYGHDYGHHYDAAVKSKGHSVHTYPAKSSHGYHKTPVVDINSHPMSIKLRFNSHSSKIKASQKHYGSGGKVKKSYSQDHPDILVHTNHKKIIQNLVEVVRPYRNRLTIVKPVREKSSTIIATGHHGYGHGGGHKHYGGHGGGHKYGGHY